MYTDDVILLSETPAGLQNSLSHLQKYCTKWGLEEDYHPVRPYTGVEVIS
jgi:hypothetical protein